jgi:hypothetical protein
MTVSTSAHISHTGIQCGAADEFSGRRWAKIILYYDHVMEGTTDFRQGSLGQNVRDGKQNKIGLIGFAEEF